jgi:hypothetical protein
MGKHCGRDDLRACPDHASRILVMFLRLRLLWQANKILGDMYVRNVNLSKEKYEAELAYMRIGRDLIEQFLIALDTPENHDQYRERLASSLSVYKDEICVREEHVR